MEVIVLYIVGSILSLSILYLIILSAVRAGMYDALVKYNEFKKQKPKVNKVPDSNRDVENLDFEDSSL
jgi:hypothetical protein